MDPTYPLFPIFSFLGGVLVLVPLPWHLQAWNAGTCYYMIWASLASLNQFVNSLVWAGNALNPAPIWCDISIRIIMGSSVGIPAASLCIVRRLHKIASVHSVTVTRAEKRRAVLIDSLICVLFPILFIALQYVVQGHRFDIYEDIGCSPAEYNTLLTFFIASMWPLVLGLTSAIFCILSIRAFNQRRLQFNQYLGSNKYLTVSRYFRLMALAMTEVSCTTPLSIFVIVLNASTTPVGPWRSWSDTHFDYSRVEQYPAVLWRRNHLLVVSLELSRWISPVCALIFFVFFGFAQEARKNYHTTFIFIAKRLGFPSTTPIQPPMNYTISHPPHSKPPNMESLAVQREKFSMSSFSTSETPYSSYDVLVISKTAVPEHPSSSAFPVSSCNMSYSHQDKPELGDRAVPDDDCAISDNQYPTSTSEHALRTVEPSPLNSLLRLPSH